MVFEILGPSGCGKSTYINKLPNRKAFKRRYFRDFALGFFYLITKDKIKFKFLLTKSISSDPRFYFKIRAFVNVVMKFAVIGFPSVIKNDEVIDEGVSQIPFIFLLSESDVIKFVSMFYYELSFYPLHTVSSLSTEVLSDRLSIRGHKKIPINDPGKTREFVSKNINIYRCYVLALGKNGINVEILDDNFSS